MPLLCPILFLFTLPLMAANFATEVAPIFAEHCLDCHGPDKKKGDLRLDLRATVNLLAFVSPLAILPNLAKEMWNLVQIAGRLNSTWTKGGVISCL